MKFFISYKRKAEEDADLADFLVSGLEGAGHEVFIDRGMKMGVDWVEEIEHRIGWCDFLVVLLSEAALDSEMVQGEIRRAYHRSKHHGTPKILPVRVRYFGSLDYELDSYLGRIQYSRWNGSDDSPTVLERILEAVAGAPQETAGRDRSGEREQARQLAESRDPRRPQPAIDPRCYALPEHALAASDPFYQERDIDETILGRAQLPGETLAIQAAHQMGKSSLLMRYLSACQQAGKRTVFMDFAMLSEPELSDLPTLLRSIAEVLIEELDLSLDPPAIRFPGHLTGFIKRKVLRAVAEPLVIAFDDVDRVLGRPYKGDFFRMLRGWSDSRGSNLDSWGRVDLALVISTEPKRLIESKRHSPFNVTTPLEPGPFDLAQMERLSERFEAQLTAEQIAALHLVTGGHPFLTRLAFYRLTGPEQMSFDELMERAADEDGPFADHLAAKLFQINRRPDEAGPDLRRAFYHVIVNRTRPGDDECDRLRAAGFVRLDGDAVVPANLLYARFFKKLGA